LALWLGSVAWLCSLALWLYLDVLDVAVADHAHGVVHGALGCASADLDDQEVLLTTMRCRPKPRLR
jgi:hypothetical protein